MGTFFVFPAIQDDQFEKFDYGDFYQSRTIYLRFRDIGMVCVLNDSCGCFSLEQNRLFGRIKGPLSPLQIREIVARLAYLNLLIKNRPIFHSEFDNGNYIISATHPDTIELNEWEPEEYGRILYFACSPLLESCMNPDIDEIKKLIMKGKYTFLFDKNGEFIKNQMYFAPQKDA